MIGTSMGVGEANCRGSVRRMGEILIGDDNESQNETSFSKLCRSFGRKTKLWLSTNRRYNGVGRQVAP